MSNTPVNFYNRIRGAYTINMYSTTIDGETAYKVDKTWNYIQQSIDDKFLPIIVCNDAEHFGVYHFTGIIDELDGVKKFAFDGGENIIYLKYVSDSVAPQVQIVPIASDDSGGDGEGGDTGTRDSYIVFLSNDGVLKYRDGETDVALLPSDIPTDTGLISITYVEPDDEVPTYSYYYLIAVELDTTTFAPSVLRFSNAYATRTFDYSADAGGFTIHPDGPFS